VDGTDAAGVTLNDDIDESEVNAVVQRVAALGLMPLVHAHEWNLIPKAPAVGLAAPVSRSSGIA
jgi:hypothetical protein